MDANATSVVVVVVVVRATEKRFSVQRIRAVQIKRHAGSFDYRVDEPELQDIHEDGEYAHHTRRYRLLNMRQVEWNTYTTTSNESPSPLHVQLSSQAPRDHSPGRRASKPITMNFIVVRARIYIVAWRNQYLTEGGVPYMPDSKPFS